MNEHDKLWASLAAVVQIATIVVEPFVIRALWRWFLVPLDLPTITWAQAFGLNLIVGVITYRWPGDRTNEQQFKASVNTFAAGAIAFCAGWFVLKLVA